MKNTQPAVDPNGPHKIDGKFSYYGRLDEYPELRLTSYGKMKLSVIPEGIIATTYNYFKTQTATFPSYERFFDSCVMHTKQADVDMKPRWRRFYDACKIKAIDTQTLTSLPPEPTSLLRILDPEQIEEEFWKIEHYKLTPQGREVMAKIGDPQNPYRTQLQGITPTNKELFDLYMLAYPKTNPLVNPLEPSFKDETAYATYIEQLATSGVTTSHRHTHTHIDEVEDPQPHTYPTDL